jgi:membrane protease YdiL (CAAX protease family)
MDTPTVTFPNKPSNTILFIGILLAFVIPLLLTIWMGAMHIDYYDKLFYSRFFYWGTALMLLGYAVKIEHQPLLIWKESNITIGYFLLSVLVLYLLSIGAAIVSALTTLGIHDSNEMMKKVIGVLKGHPAMIFFIALTAGVTEELIFRGYLLTRLSQLFKNNAVAIIISSLLFSALHYKYGSYRELVFTFLIGALFSVYYIEYRNIKALMFAHFLIDFINMNLAQHIKLK